MQRSIILVLALGCSQSHSTTPGDGSADAAAPDAGDDTWPAAPPAKICGDHTVLDGPAEAPPGAITLPPGNNSAALDGPAGSTYWFAPGVHTLDDGPYSQIQPTAGDHYIGAPGAILDGRNRNLYAFTQHATGVVIEHLTIQNFGTGTSNNNEGVVNHDSGHDWTVRYNTITNNDGAGLFVGSNNVVAYNCLANNGQYGFSAYEPDGVEHVVIDHNEIAGNNTDDWETRSPGCGCTGGGKFWNTHDAQVTYNYVHDNHSTGVWADTDNSVFAIEHNYFEANEAEAVFYEISYNAVVRYNTFVKNALGKGKEFSDRGDSFPVSAIYFSESGGDARVSATYAVAEVAHNHFVDNWAGVTLWENADRFCASPANTSSSYCTLIPATTLATCGQGSVGNAPYLDDCRWKTQHVHVHDNVFELDKAAIGCTTAFCGRQAILSNYGTYPSWSPYHGDVISRAITLAQDNVFETNQYIGPWGFLVLDTSHPVDFAGWQAAPYNQDRGSSRN